MSQSYLDFLNEPTSENVKQVHRKARKEFKITQATASEIIGINIQTYKKWHADVNSDSYRVPHKTTWNLFLYELEARRLGFDNLLDFFKK